MASFTLLCESDLHVIGLQEGEAVVTLFRALASFTAASVISAWVASSTKIKQLSLFFAHWLGGLILCLAFEVEDMMVTVCWTGSDVKNFVKTLKFVELTASNMEAITNLAICINFAQIIMSHRNATRVRSVSSPRLLLLFLVVSMGAAISAVPFMEEAIILATGFWFTSTDERKSIFVASSAFYMEFIVGVCMFITMVWLLLFWEKEIKESWKIHLRVRYYFGLTLLATVVNLALGICGTIFTSSLNSDTRLLTFTWMLRYIHIALDTVVLYGVLGERGMDERTIPGTLPKISLEPSSEYEEQSKNQMH